MCIRDRDVIEVDGIEQLTCAFAFKDYLAGLDFLKKVARWIESNICYDDFFLFSFSVVVYDKIDQDTLWVRVYYSDSDRAEIDFHLKTIYTLLHSDGNASSLPDLNIDAIDYCTFGNSKPFRIKIRTSFTATHWQCS